LIIYGKNSEQETGKIIFQTLPSQKAENIKFSEDGTAVVFTFINANGDKSVKYALAASGKWTTGPKLE